MTPHKLHAWDAYLVETSEEDSIKAQSKPLKDANANRRLSFADYMQKKSENTTSGRYQSEDDSPIEEANLESDRTVDAPLSLDASPRIYVSKYTITTN